MPIPITDTENLTQFLQGVVGRADHHAENVDEICLAIAGAILWRKDAGDTQGGRTANQLWVSINARTFVFSYDHENSCVQMKEGTQLGPVVRTFDNNTSVHDLKTFFESL